MINKIKYQIKLIKIFLKFNNLRNKKINKFEKI